MKKLIVGQIVINEKVVGTGFLVSPDIVVTAKHVVFIPDEVVSDSYEEKEVVFRGLDNYDINGETMNLVEAINKRIDCVFIKLNENATNDLVCDLISANNEIEGFNCRVVGFPKLTKGETVLYGKITHKSDDDNLLLSINEGSRLQNYEGLSGSPLLIRGNIVGIVVAQNSSEEIKSIPVSYIKQNLDCSKIQIISRKIAAIHEGSLNMDIFRDDFRQVISMVGPRYSKTLNVKTGIYSYLCSLLKKDESLEILKKIQLNINQCVTYLLNYLKDDSLSYNSNEEISIIIDKLQNYCQYLDDNENVKVDELTRINSSLVEYKNKLVNIFELEKNQFEITHGKGTYNNKSWRGFMATYNSINPTYYLDELNSAIKQIPLIIKLLNTDLISGTEKSAILITGKGGIGKTHLLCDIVNEFISKDIPAVILLGEMFKSQQSADNVILKRFNFNGTIEDFFTILNEYGIQNNVYVPICIDAINEVNDSSYWNINLPLLTAKLETFSNIKIIISCRTLYLKEYLENEKIEKYLKLQHDGFSEMESEALREFCVYYGVNINYNSVFVPEFMNPLFLKMLCEIAKEKDDKTIVVEDIHKLMNDFFDLKNKAITNKYPEYFSIRDNVVPKILISVAKLMADNKRYYILWNELKDLVKQRLAEMDIKEISSGLIKQIISENLLRESDDDDSKITFAYQKFFEYYYAKTLSNNDEKTIFNAVINNEITLGTLEMIQILYFQNNKEELISKLDNKRDAKVLDSFISGLYWRKPDEVNEKTVIEIKKAITSLDENVRRRTIIGLLAVSLKNNFIFNASFLHEILKNMIPYQRDLFLYPIILDQYDQEKVISDLCERAINMEKNSIFKIENVFLWEIVLCWFTGSNDIMLRDKASKGLLNLFRLYHETIIKIIYDFKDVDDDYIHERIWQSAYSTIILIKNYDYYILISNYIKSNIISLDKWPQNVLIRDYLRNIFEFAYYNGWCGEEDVSCVRPKYHSPIHQVNYDFIKNNKDLDIRLFWNCQESDFVKYTIPFDVEDYGINKEDVGAMIYEDMIRSGYEICQKYDKYIDYKYGSLRSRDEKVERIGKKYQKIYLYREMGNIFDNYTYAPRYSYDDYKTIAPEQGNNFREIDLTRLSRVNDFKGPEFKYPFYRCQKSEDMAWFEKDDIEEYILEFIEYSFNKEEYYMLQGYLSTKETCDKEYREVWVQVRTYLYQKNTKEELLLWFNNKDFDGRWMPEGYGQLYECCIGEYPWSPTMINYFSQDDGFSFREKTSPPCQLITTVNDFLTEKDSSFCEINDDNSYMFPTKQLFDMMKLSWNGLFGYNSEGKTVIINADNNTIFIEKNYLINFLKNNNLDVVWTVLGGKQKVGSTLLGRKYPGSSSFSFTYNLTECCELKRNHKIYCINNTIKNK